MSQYSKESHTSPLSSSVGAAGAAGAAAPSSNNTTSTTITTTAATTTTSTSATTTAATTSKTGMQLVFIHKLYSMLEDETLNHLIWWCESNGGSSSDSFMLIPNTEFSKLLSVYFKHSNIASFVRQLNMYGFHKVNESNESQTPIAQQQQQTPTPTSSTPTQLQTQQKEEVISTWEFKHNSGFFRKGDLENLKNIKRRSSKNVAREINIKQIDRIQNYIPKTYDDDEFYDNNEIFMKLNELSHNFNTIKNDHFNLTKKYEWALEDLTRTNQDLMTLLDLIKDLSNNTNKDLNNLLNKIKSNIINRNSLRENDLSNLSSLYNNNLIPTSVPPLISNISRINSFDSSSRDSIFMNKDIRYSSVSSSSKRHQSILYDPLTTDPFQSRKNSTPELIPQPQQVFSPVSPSQPMNGNSTTTVATTTTQGPGPNAHYFQDNHFLHQVDHHQQQQQQQLPSSFPPHHLHQHHILNSRDAQNYNSLSSNSVPPLNKSVSNTYLPSTQQQQPQQPQPPLIRTRENSVESASHPPQHLHFPSQPSIAMTKLQPPFEHNETILRRGRSDSVSDRVLFKRSKN